MLVAIHNCFHFLLIVISIGMCVCLRNVEFCWCIAIWCFFFLVYLAKYNKFCLDDVCLLEIYVVIIEKAIYDINGIYVLF